VTSSVARPPNGAREAIRADAPGSPPSTQVGLLYKSEEQHVFRIRTFSVGRDNRDRPRDPEAIGVREVNLALGLHGKFPIELIEQFFAIAGM
jgi:hypothetical protein